MIKEFDYVMGTMPDQGFGESGPAKTVDLLITEDCNLRCKYCYLHGKNNSRRMSLDIAKKAVDFVLTDRTVSNTPAVIWEMGGGEVFMEIDLIDQITDYIILRMEELKHPWLNNYCISICTNGLLYSSPKVQKYLEKNKGRVSVAMTIDGSKEKHDASRVFADGSGSYDKVVENMKLWHKQYPNMQRLTKATFSHDDLPYLKDSIINLWNLGIKYVMANVVFEDVWQEGDDVLFENQLKELADYTLENGLWKDYTVRFFDPSIGFPVGKDELGKSYCGSGKFMLTIDSEGKIYPCMRFTDFSLGNKEGLDIGDIYNGINKDKFRALVSFDMKSISPKKCIECEVASGCAYCAGFNYDAADTDTIFQRATYHCKMHKANVRACEYFWDKFKSVTGLESLRDQHRETKYSALKNDKEAKALLFVLNDAVTPHCCYNTKTEQSQEMSKDIFMQGLAYAAKNNFIPVFVGDNIDKYTDNVGYINIASPHSLNINENSVIVFDEKVDKVPSEGEACIILISKHTIDNFYKYIKEVRKAFKRICITIKDTLNWDENDANRYEKQLEKVTELIISDAKEKCYYEINVLSDCIKERTMNNCDAGEQSFTLAPNGTIYICPAFYFDQPENYIGSLDKEIKINNEYLLKLEHAPICSACDAYQCNRCKHFNQKSTGEINTPSRMQCIISHVERNATRKLQLKLQEENMAVFMDILPELDYKEPYELISRSNVLK